MLGDKNKVGEFLRIKLSFNYTSPPTLFFSNPKVFKLHTLSFFMIELSLGAWIGIGALITLFVIMDFYTKKVPSIFGTGIILILLVIRPEALIYGVIAGTFSLLLYEAGLFKGLADIKLMIIFGLLFSDIVGIISFLISLTLISFMYNAVMVSILKKEEYAGTIPIALAFLMSIIGGYVQ